jgi:hypothetical protein
MNPIRLMMFEPAHALALALGPKAEASLRQLDDLPALAGRYALAGPAWTLLLGATPAACGGVVRFWSGVGELWCWTGLDAGRAAVAFARHARVLFAALLRPGGGFHRLQAHVREDDMQARGFAEFLGLAREGRCPGYGPDGATHLTYGRYREWKA